MADWAIITGASRGIGRAAAARDLFLESTALRKGWSLVRLDRSP